MRVLIVATNRERAPLPVAPIGAAVIASVTKEAGHEVRFVDFMFQRRPKKALAAAIASFRPEAIGMSIRNLDSTAWLKSTFYLDDEREYVRVAKTGGVPVIVGGPCLGVHPGGITEYVGADAGIWGDGERSFVEVLKRIEAGESYADVPGVVTYTDDSAPRVNPQFRVEDIGSIARPRVWQWTNFRQYADRTGPLPIQTRRGCVFNCSYCTYKFIEGDSYRSKPIPQVVDELREMRDAFPGAPVEFVDSTFNVPLPYTIEMCEAIAKADLGLHLHTSGFNPAAVNKRLIEAMTAAGFSQVVITPETASERMLRGLQKGFTVRSLRKCARLRRTAPWSVLWVFLLGGPGEDEDTLQETFRFLEEEIPSTDMVFLQPGLRVYPNTKLHRDAIAEGLVSPDESLIRPFYYLSPRVPEIRYREILVEQIAKHPNYTTIKDVLHPLFPLYLRIAGGLRVAAPISRAAGGLSKLATFGLRRPRASV
jgi:radical SAM superfamily enzyme YgiQ (UPF0313 family)